MFIISSCGNVLEAITGLSRLPKANSLKLGKAEVCYHSMSQAKCKRRCGREIGPTMASSGLLPRQPRENAACILITKQPATNFHVQHIHTNRAFHQLSTIGWSNRYIANLKLIFILSVQFRFGFRGAQKMTIRVQFLIFGSVWHPGIGAGRIAGLLHTKICIS